MKFDHDASGKSHYPEVSTRAASVWTETHIYFALWSRYDSLNVYEGEDPAAERWQLWDRDVVEVFLNPQPERVNHYYEFEVAPNNQWIDLEIDKTRRSSSLPPEGLTSGAVVKKPPALFAADNLLAVLDPVRGLGRDLHVATGANFMFQRHHGRVAFARK